MANVKITDFIEQSTLDNGDFFHVKKEGLSDRKVSWGNIKKEVVKPVASVADLRLLAGSYDGQQVSLTGYYAGSTKGGGTLVWDATSTAADDGGVTFAVAGVATGRWVRQLDGFVTPEMFGCFDGMADASPFFEAALNCTLVSKVTAKGNYNALTRVIVTRGDVTLDLTGAVINCVNMVYDKAFNGGGAWLRFTGFIAKNTTVTGSITAGDKALNIGDTSGLIAGDIVRVFSNEKVYSSGEIDSLKLDINRISNVTGSVITLDYPIDSNWDGVNFPISIEVLRPLRNCHVIGGEVIGGGATESPLANGRGQSGVLFYAVDGFTAKNVTTKNLHANGLMTERCLNGLFHKCTIIGRDYNFVIVDGVNSSWYGIYAIRSRNISISESSGVRVRHMCDAAQCITIRQIGNTCTDSHRAAFGTHETVYDVIIDSNTVERCSSGVTVRSWDAIISNNIINAETGITTAVMLATDLGGELVITGNRVRAYGSNAALAITGVYDYLSISGNTVKNPARGILFATERLNNCVVSDNIIDANIGVRVEAVLKVINGVAIKDNTIKGFSGIGIEFRGALNASLPADFISIKDNVFIAVNELSGSGVLMRGEGWYGENVYITDNDMMNDSSNCVQITNAQRFKYYPIIENNGQFNKTLIANRSQHQTINLSYPASATMLRGGVIDRISPSNGSPDKWVVTTAGTEGTVSAVTGSISAGSTTLTLVGNSDTKLTPGMFITIAGAGSGGATLSTRINSMNDDLTVAEVANSASTTVSDEVLQRRNPVASTVGVLA